MPLLTILPTTLIRVPTPRSLRFLALSLERPAEEALAEHYPSPAERPIMVQLTGEGFEVIAGIERFEAALRAGGLPLIRALVMGSEYASALLRDRAAVDERLAAMRYPTIVEHSRDLAERERIMALLYPEKAELRRLAAQLKTEQHQAAQLKRRRTMLAKAAIRKEAMGTHAEAR